MEQKSENIFKRNVSKENFYSWMKMELYVWEAEIFHLFIPFYNQREEERKENVKNVFLHVQIFGIQLHGIRSGFEETKNKDVKEKCIPSMMNECSEATKHILRSLSTPFQRWTTMFSIVIYMYQKWVKIKFPFSVIFAISQNGKILFVKFTFSSSISKILAVTWY